MKPFKSMLLSIICCAAVLLAFCFQDFARSEAESQAPGGDTGRQAGSTSSYASCQRNARAIIQSVNRFGLERACNSLQHREGDTEPVAPEWPTYGLWTRKDR